ncbi:MAG: hypothetical protein OHK005_02830 [Candidatus Methylacidiphilales bacterium]
MNRGCNGRIPFSKVAGGNGADDDGSGGHNRTFPHRHPRSKKSTGSNPRTSLNNDWAGDQIESLSPVVMRAGA